MSKPAVVPVYPPCSGTWTRLPHTQVEAAVKRASRLGCCCFELRELEVECAEQRDDEGLAVDAVACCEPQRGCNICELCGKAGVVEVDADADNGVAQGGVRLDGGFDEDAAEFFAVEQDVVGPADVGCEAGGGPYCGLSCEACGQRDPEGFAEVQQGPCEGAEVETRWLVESAGRGVPVVASSAAACGLLVGEVDGAFGRSVGCCCEQERIGGVDAGEVL